MNAFQQGSQKDSAHKGSAAGQQVPTTIELRALEQAAAVLTAVVELFEADRDGPYAHQLLDDAQTICELANRQPDPSRGEFLPVAVREHKTELRRHLRVPDQSLR